MINSLAITNCEISGNYSGNGFIFSGGGAIRISEVKTTTITESSITYNTAKLGGAIFIDDGELEYVANTEGTHRFAFYNPKYIRWANIEELV